MWIVLNVVEFARSSAAFELGHLMLSPRRGTGPGGGVNHEAHATRNQQGTRSARATHGAYVVVGRDNAWRSRAPGPHAHGNAARHVVDGLRTEV